MHALWKLFNTHSERSSGGYIGITLSVCLSVCLSADLCPALNFISVWCCLTIIGKRVCHHETMCQVHSWFWYDVDLWPQQGLWHIFKSWAHNYFLFWYWFTIFGTCIYHHERMCCVHSWSDTTLTFDLKVKFIGFWSVFLSDLNFCLLWHWYTIFWTWVYHQEKMCILKNHNPILWYYFIKRTRKQ